MSQFLQQDRRDFSFSPTDVYTVWISNHVGLRVYSDTRPANWKIAAIQKGLILLYDGTEMVGEGTGFGVPVVVCSDETYFSGTSKVGISGRGGRWIIRKEFTFDRIARNVFRNARLENRTARAFFAYMAGLYQMHPKFRFLTLKKLAEDMGVRTSFFKVRPLGKVEVIYTIDKQCIRVNVDFNHLKMNKIGRIFILNEQGSRFFRTYTDSQKTKFLDGRIGAWDGIEAEHAGLFDHERGFGFRLWRLEGCVLRRGREYLTGSLDWAGLDYEVTPKTAGLEYMIEILGA